jgi:hypothetical protein
MTISKGIAIIILSSVVCFILATTADMAHQELGALANFILPPILAVLASITFSLGCLLSRNNIVRIIILLFCVVYIIYTGIALHFEKDDWPFVMM